MSRAQSHVVGVALLLAVTTAALGGVTIAVGEVLKADTASVDAGRVASDLDAAIQPVAVTGRHTGTVSFLDGRLRTVERDVRVVNETGTVERIAADAVVYETERVRVAVVFGAIVRGHSGTAGVVTDPPIAVGSRGIAFGVPVVGNAFDVGGSGVTTVGLRSRVTHDRASLGESEWAVAVETTTPGAWERYFEQRGATTDRRDFDDDGTPSVVARFPGERDATLVVHRLRLEVTGRV